ncbi:uncharacterized protein FPRO_12704 [Fusarium proliferatum ET1]|uniref:7alpha-cephem-methoxylase P8 chain n=1 Tax=Fusarium proliferatum (strain ET1) TaxID=1227346 RepID=A0A1L7W654_FUSPR|nr:uncharacterized protein FPRO_12704 [Fusarium proliferatum ET1]CZR48094.1 uncharacterized protein FPRO_12704 [Fusarium proliferatum ET1]
MVYSVTAELSFLKDHPLYEVEKPYQIISGLAASTWQTNCVFESVPGIRIINCRDHMSDFTIEANGFEFFKSPSTHLLDHGFVGSQEKNIRDEAIECYLRSTIAQARKRFNATEIFCFDWRVRSRGAKELQSESDEQDIRHHLLDVAHVVHLDFSLDGGKTALTRNLRRDELTRYSTNEYRVRIINIWRPINDVVYDCPLAFCDPRTIDPRDLRDVDKVHQDHVEESAYLTHAESQQWYYLHEQSKHEAAVFLTWDSDSGGKLVTPPHAAFLSKPEGPARVSVEVRLIVVTSKQHEQ